MNPTAARLAATLLLLIACPPARSRAAQAEASLPAAPTHLALGPMLGHVSDREAHVWAKSSRPARLSLKIGRHPDLSDARLIPGPALGPETDCMASVRAADLEPATRYHYLPLLDDQPALAPPYPSFVTAPPAGTPGRTRVAFVSCTGRDPALSAACWAEMAARGGVDVLLMLGDNHYGDSTRPAVQRRHYVEQRRGAGFREVTARTPTYAIWDDHDYGPNNSDGTARGKRASLRTFREHWANPAYGEADNPGVYFRLSRGDIDFFMLDVRYHRSPNNAPDDGTKTVLGEKQLEWLRRELLASTARVKFLASGSEWQTNGHADSWTSFDRERTALFDFIADNKVEGVVLLSGDRHFSAGYQVRGRLIEVTSGPLGSKTVLSPNLPEMFFNLGEGKMYCVFEVDTTNAAAPALAIEVFRAGEGRVYQRPFTWDEVNGRTPIPRLPPPLRAPAPKP